MHDMVAQAIHRWGTDAQRASWLPRLGAGELIAAFALTEPNVGSDAKAVESTATLSGDSYVLNGQKKWNTFGQIADLFLVLARSEGKPTAFLSGKGAAPRLAGTCSGYGSGHGGRWGEWSDSCRQQRLSHS